MIKNILFITVLIVCSNCNDSHNQKNNDLEMESTNTKIEANKNLVRLWIEEGWNKNRNKELADRIFSKDWTTATPFPNQPLGPEGALFFVEEYRKSFSDYHITITHIVADTKFVTYRFEVSAIHTGNF